jgi:G3E family GTPase
LAHIKLDSLREADFGREPLPTLDSCVGKTTLPNHVLANREGRGVAVIVNDMSEVNIDASLVERCAKSAGAAIARTEEKMVEMRKGCIGCIGGKLREDLLLEVRKLADEAQFDCLLIEHCGIGEPMPLSATFHFEDENGDSLNHQARSDAMVTEVDALNLLADLSSIDLLEQPGETASPEDRRLLAALLTEQIEFANGVVINKIDRVDAARRAAVTAAFKALDPVAEIVCADQGEVPLRQILGTGRFNLERANAMPSWARELEGKHTSETEACGTESFVLCSTEPLHRWRLRTPGGSVFGRRQQFRTDFGPTP